MAAWDDVTSHVPRPTSQKHFYSYVPIYNRCCSLRHHLEEITRENKKKQKTHTPLHHNTSPFKIEDPCKGPILIRKNKGYNVPDVLKKASLVTGTTATLGTYENKSVTVIQVFKSGIQILTWSPRQGIGQHILDTPYVSNL